MCRMGCVLQDAAGYTVAAGPVQLLQGEETAACDLLHCVDYPLQCCLFLSRAAGKAHWDAVCQQYLSI